MRREIRRIVKENGLTAIYVTHDQEEALAMADRMAVLSNGVIGQLGTPDEIYRTPRSAYVANFIGETNLIEGEVLEFRSGFAMVKTAGGPMVGRVSDPAWQPTAGEKVTLSIRPEAWRLGSAQDNHLTGKIVERTYLGQRIQYWVETALGRQQVVELNPHVIHEPGESPVIVQSRHDDVVVLKS
jgi:ABC-type Fe3+/spermidine/putrescine transport system ATPase subunit